MQKPLENMLNTPEINIPFCISWANHTWTQSPKKSDQKRVLDKTGNMEMKRLDLNILIIY